MLAKVVVRRGPQAEEEAQHVHLTHVPTPPPRTLHLGKPARYPGHPGLPRGLDPCYFVEKRYPDVPRLGVTR